MSCAGNYRPKAGCGGGDGLALPGPEEVVTAVDSYNAAIGRVAFTTGAEVVDLDAVVQAARTAGTDATLVGEDGFHPSTAGHKAVADAFAAVLRRSPP